MATSFTEVVTRAKARIEMSQSGYVEDSEWLEYARDAYRMLYGILCKKFKDYFVKPGAELTVGSDGSVDVYADFFRLHSVDIKYGTEWIPLGPKRLSERSTRTGPRSRVFRSLGYRLMGRKIYLFPSESAASKTIRLWHQPLAEKLSALTDEMPIDMEQWSEFLVLRCMKMALMKEESGTAEVDAELNVIMQMIEDEAMQRMVEDPEGVEDVRGDDFHGYYPEEF